MPSLRFHIGPVQSNRRKIIFFSFCFFFFGLPTGGAVSRNGGPRSGPDQRKSSGAAILGHSCFDPRGSYLTPDRPPLLRNPQKKNKKKKKISIFVTTDFVAIYTCPLQGLGFGLIQGKLGGLDRLLNSASFGTGLVLTRPPMTEPAPSGEREKKKIKKKSKRA